MIENRAGKLRFYWIAIATGIFTIWACLKIIAGSFITKNSRLLVNKIMYTWSRQLLGLSGVKIKVEGSNNFPSATEQPIIVMCNHSSSYDIPISAIVLNTCLRMLTKKELFKIPILASALNRGEFISVDRHNHEQAIKDLQKAKEKMLDGVVLWVAPEGTRSKDGQLARFKLGGFHVAIESGALIVPLVIKNAYKIQPGKEMVLYLNQKVDVELCPVINSKDYSPEQIKDLAADVRNEMLIKLNQVP